MLALSMTVMNVMILKQNKVLFTSMMKSFINCCLTSNLQFAKHFAIRAYPARMLRVGARLTSIIVMLDLMILTKQLGTQ